MSLEKWGESGQQKALNLTMDTLSRIHAVLLFPAESDSPWDMRCLRGSGDIITRLWRYPHSGQGIFFSCGNVGREVALRLG